MREKGWYWVFYRDPDGEGWYPSYFNPNAGPCLWHPQGIGADRPVFEMPAGPAWYRNGSRIGMPSEKASNHWTIGERILEPPK